MSFKAKKKTLHRKCKVINFEKIYTFLSQLKVSGKSAERISDFAPCKDEGKCLGAFGVVAKTIYRLQGKNFYRVQGHIFCYFFCYPDYFFLLIFFKFSRIFLLFFCYFSLKKQQIFSVIFLLFFSNFLNFFFYFFLKELKFFLEFFLKFTRNKTPTTHAVEPFERG